MTKHSEPERAGSVPPDEDRPDLAGAEPEAAFGRLFDAYAAPLHRYLARRADTETANDLVAETFLQALGQRAHYDPQRATVRSWLYGIATNLLRRHMRREVRGLNATARLAEASETSTSGPEGRVPDQVDAQASTRALAGALAELSPMDRDTLLLSSWGELSTSEIAEALGVPTGTVRSRLHRVRRQLRADLAQRSTQDSENGKGDSHA